MDHTSHEHSNPEPDAPAASGRAMHVVLLNQPFHPDVVATAQMAKDLADHLVREGVAVSAVASRSIYGEKGGSLPKRESIPVHDATGDAIGAIEVHRVGSSLFGKAGTAARLLDFGLWYALAAWRVLTLPKPDVVVGFTTPPFIAGVGLLARVLRGSKSVYWVMDLYPDMPIACGMMKPRSLAARLLEALNRVLLKRSTADVVLGRCMRDVVLAKGVSPEKVEVIPVWPVEALPDPIPHADNPYRREWSLSDSCCVMYSGNFGIGHDAATVCAAMERLRGRPGLKFVFVGGGKRRAEVEAFIEDKGIKSASWREYVPREDLSQSLAAGDIHLISMRSVTTGLMVPSKLYGILGSGRASVFIGDEGSEIARVLREFDCGVVVPEGDTDGLCEALVGLASDPARRESLGANARRAAEALSRDKACAQWSALLRCVTGRDGGSGPIGAFS